ncbi:MAG: O-antigen ligase family protein [Candidatus Omnitrophica bacterium]|nr:O-antigen ligase family protein [Candidatus Omnitrophota bacterium]
MPIKLDINLDSAIRCAIYIMVIALPVSNGLVESSIGFGLFLWLIKHGMMAKRSLTGGMTLKDQLAVAGQEFRPVHTPVNLLIGSFLSICFLASVFGVQPLVSIRGFYGKAFEWFVVFFLILDVFKEKKDIAEGMRILMIVSLVLAVDGLVQFYWLKRDILVGRPLTSSGQVSATFPSANSLGAFLATTIPAAIAYLFFKKRWRVVLKLAVIIILLWGFILTLSRGAWLALVFAVVLAGFAVPVLTVGRMCSKRIFFLLLTVLIVAGVFVSEFDFAKKHFWEANTGMHRIKMWEDSFKMVHERPLLGFGVNTYMRNFQSYRRDHSYFLTYAHNCYVQMLVEIGIMGFTAFLGLVIIYFKNFLHRLRILYDEDHELFVLGMGIFSGLAAFFMHSFVDVDFYSLPLARLWWYMMGLGMAVMLIKNDKGGKNKVSGV